MAFGAGNDPRRCHEVILVVAVVVAAQHLVVPRLPVLEGVTGGAQPDHRFARREVGADVEQIATHLGGPQRRIRHATTQELIVAHEIYRRDTGPLRTVFVIPRRGGALLNTLGGSPRLRILLAVSVSGLVCFALSRLLTNRLKALQKASRQLANGDLNTRLKVRERGGDETDELARDFNTMADQLQGRMQGQKRLLRDVSHELRSPLARLRIALALAEADTPGRTDHLARIEQEAERLEALIAQLHSSQAGEVRLDSPVDLVPLLRQLCEDGNFEAKVKRTEELDAAIPKITALDPDVLIVTGDHSTPSMLATSG